ncbi:MAG: DUF4238 domain-containing protein [Oscillospiraceae bacterium]|nr:DUF4238 domain-containing protein [Oscillospiraceae bacterium]
MTQKTKKQHTVPQFYLYEWCIPGTHQVHVYDKITDSKRINNILDVASERYFYDIAPEELFPDSFIESLYQNGLEIANDTQAVEKALAVEIEQPFSEIIKAILEKTNELTPWFIKNCFFIKEEKKQELSAYLALQYVRTKYVRNNIRDAAERLTQFLAELGASESTISEYSLTEKQAKNVHIKMLVDGESLSEITHCFNRLTWMLAINKTDEKFYTSDCPIGTYGHIKDPLLPMNGLASEGVEVFFPLSPNVILIMVDGVYHYQYLLYDRKYVEITERANVDFYNSLLAMQANRLIISSDGDFSLIKRMLDHDRDILKPPSIQIN